MALGLIYMNARYYVPSLGRFASADTLVPDPTNPQQFNRFSYVLNTPLRFTDPTGHWPEPTMQKFQLGLHPIDSLQLVDALNTRVDDIQNQVDFYGDRFSQVGGGVGAAVGAPLGSKIGALLGSISGCLASGGPPTGCGGGVGALGGGTTGAIIGTGIGTGIGIFMGYSSGRWIGEYYGGKNIHTQLQTIQRIFTPENGIFQREDGLYLKTTELSMHLIEQLDMWQTYNQVANKYEIRFEFHVGDSIFIKFAGLFDKEVAAIMEELFSKYASIPNHPAEE
jgi:RHS repeat-associated protein